MSQPPIWVHGASVGELRAARPLIEALAGSTGAPLLVTANSVTGRNMVADWRLPGWSAQLAPLDSRAAMTRFLRRWRPRLLVSLEGEFWPNRFALCKGAGVPVIGVGSRLSAASAARGGPAASLRRRTLGLMTEVWPLDAANADRLAAAGMPKEILRPAFNAKLLHLPDAGTAAVPPDLAAWNGLNIVLAASVHAGEEAMIVGAFAVALAIRPDLRLILAPRHPGRAADFARACASRQLAVATRSRREMPQRLTPVYLADTLHDMPFWYAAAPVTIIGGTFLNLGGHTPVEPVLAGSFPIHGPDIANHADAFAALARAGACARADSAGELADMIVKFVPHESHNQVEGNVRAGAASLASLRKVMQSRIREICDSVARHSRDGAVDERLDT